METDPSPNRRYHGIVVSHTHWDRAWYLPFRRFRHRLVRLVDRLLDLLDENPAYRAFTLDGQTILLDDYLKIRPDQEDRLRRLIEEERLLIGPWYTLPDLFLVSGEAILRNLQIGHDRCDEFGGGMPVGYIPDPFGHIAQMPQILCGFGLDTYIFMRGLGRKEKERLGGIFDWEAPDGSTPSRPSTSRRATSPPPPWAIPTSSAGSTGTRRRSTSPPSRCAITHSSISPIPSTGSGLGTWIARATSPTSARGRRTRGAFTCRGDSSSAGGY